MSFMLGLVLAAMQTEGTCSPDRGNPSREYNMSIVREFIRLANARDRPGLLALTTSGAEAYSGEGEVVSLVDAFASPEYDGRDSFRITGQLVTEETVAVKLTSQDDEESIVLFSLTGNCISGVAAL